MENTFILKIKLLNLLFILEWMIYIYVYLIKDTLPPLFGLYEFVYYVTVCVFLSEFAPR